MLDFIANMFGGSTAAPASQAAPAAIPGLAAAISAAAPQLADVDRATWEAALTAPMLKADITKPRRVASFTGQVAVESGGFRDLVEDLSYSAERLCQVWPSRFPDLDTADPCARNPEALANRVYSGRLGNGPEGSGDGWRFRGRGLIQLTGRANYTALATWLADGRTADDLADWLATSEGAAASACWFWSAHGLNAMADAWQVTASTQRINGGSNGLQARLAACNAALKAVGG